MAAQISADFAFFSPVYYSKSVRLCILKMNFGVAAQMIHLKNGATAHFPRIWLPFRSFTMTKSINGACLRENFTGGRADDAFSI